MSVVCSQALLYPQQQRTPAGVRPNFQGCRKKAGNRGREKYGLSRVCVFPLPDCKYREWQGRLLFAHACPGLQSKSYGRRQGLLCLLRFAVN